MDTADLRRVFDEHTLDFVTDHPFFATLRRSDPPTVTQFVRVFEQLVSCFPPIVEHAANTATSTLVKGLLLENLDDERGHGDPRRSHHAIYCNFLHSNSLERLPTRPRAMADTWQRDLMGMLDDADGDGDVLGLLAAEEFLAIPCLSRMYDAIQPHFPGGDHEYFTTHLALEEEHMTELLEAIDTLDEGDKAEVVPACHRAMAAWDRYFTRMDGVLNAPRPALALAS